MIYANLFLTFCILIIPILLKLYPPKRINSYYGYRTPRSMKSDKNWKLGNQIYSDYFLRFGFISAVIQYTLFFLFNESLALWVSTVLWVFSVFFPIYLTEKHLKNP